MPFVFVVNGLALWLLNVFITAAIAAFAIMYPDVILGLVVDVLNWLADKIAVFVSQYGIEFPSLNDAVQALPPEMLQVFVRLGLPHAIAILVAAYLLSFVGWIWRFFFVIKTVA